MALRSMGRKLGPPTRAKLKLKPKAAESFYLSPEWRLLCEEIKRERWPHLLATRGHCCEDPGCRAPHTPETRIFFDHVLERKDGPILALVKSNILGRCGSSHSRKTAAARARRMSEKG